MLSCTRPGEQVLGGVPDPQIVDDGDAIVRVDINDGREDAVSQFMEAYEVFSQSARPEAQKVALTPDGAG